MTQEQKNELLAELEVLNSKKEQTTDFMLQMEIAGDIHAIIL